jgi:nucleoside-diphosphate-sugar epimerase
LTGVSGYLGSVLANRLSQLEEVESITGIDVTPPKTELPAKVRFVQMDMRSPDLAQAVAGHDVVVHTAFIVLWPVSMDPRERDDINLNGVRNVARAAVAAKVRKFLHTSSNFAYDPILVKGKSGITEDFPLCDGKSAIYYWNGKSDSERALHEILDPAEIPLTMLRAPYIVGPRNAVTVKTFRKNACRLPGHNIRAQLIHEDDLASAFVQALRTDMPGAFNVVPDDFMLGSQVLKAVGVKFVPVVPLWMARIIMKVKWRWFGAKTDPSWLDAALTDFTCSNAKLRATGWKPMYNSEEALRSAVEAEAANSRTS